MNVDQVLGCFNYDELVKVRMVIYNGYALVWWNQYIRKVRDSRRRHINTWLDLRLELTVGFGPASYAKDLYNKLKRMYQWSKSIKEYFKEMEVALMKANVLESHEVTMARFLHGLDMGVQDIVVLYHYSSLDDLVHQATRPLRVFGRVRIKIVESESSHEGSSSSSEVESSIDSSYCEGDLLTVKKLMSSLVNEDIDSQRENIYHFRCQVMAKLCSLIIDRGSNVNVASLMLVEKLSLPTLVHPRPCKL
ncbi:hypothetical protein CR513_50124, partial [Mucuna pruriens]